MNHMGRLVRRGRLPLGFSVVGGTDSPRGPMGIYVKSVFSHGLVAHKQLLQKGDELLSANRVTLCGLTHAEALRVIKWQARDKNTSLVFAVRRSESIIFVRIGQNDADKTTSDYRNYENTIPENKTSEQFQIDIEKEDEDVLVLKAKRQLAKYLLATNSRRMIKAKAVLKRQSPDEKLGLGIAIHSSDDDNCVQTVRVEQIDEDSPARRGGLEIGDRILRVDGIELTRCTREQCLRLFQDAGLITVLVIFPAQIVDAVRIFAAVRDGGSPAQPQVNHSIDKSVSRWFLRGNTSRDKTSKLYARKSARGKGKESKMSSRFYATAHATSRSYDVQAEFANVLAIATDADSDFPPPPPPVPLPTAAVWHREKENALSTTTASAVATTLSPDELPSPPRLGDASPHLRYYHKHSASASVENRPVVSYTPALAPANIGRSQIFDEMDERVSRSRRAQHYSRQNLQSRDSTIGRLTDGDRMSRKDVPIAAQGERNRMRAYQIDGNTPGATYYSAKHRNGESSVGPYSCASRPHSKIFCESEDSALPESSSSMSPTSSSASTSSAGVARFKWTKDTEGTACVSQAISYPSRGRSYASKMPPLSYTSDADSGVRSSFAESDDAAIGRLGAPPNLQFGYGRWVRGSNGKWHRVGDIGRETPRARSADQFAPPLIGPFKHEAVLKKPTPLERGSLQNAGEGRLLQRSITDDLRTRPHQRNASADVWQPRESEYSNCGLPHSARNVNQLVKQFSNSSISHSMSEDPTPDYSQNKRTANDSFRRAFVSMTTNARPSITTTGATKCNYNDADIRIWTGDNKSTEIATTGAIVTTVRTTIVEENNAGDLCPMSSEPVERSSFPLLHNNRRLNKCQQHYNHKADNKQQIVDHNNNITNLESVWEMSTRRKSVEENVWQKASEQSQAQRILSNDKEHKASSPSFRHSAATDSAHQSTKLDNNDHDDNRRMRCNNDSNIKKNGNEDGKNEDDVSLEQLSEIRDQLDAAEFTRYYIFGVSLRRSIGVEEGSVGLILTSALADPTHPNVGNEFITIQRVITGSIADYDERLQKGDRVFYIQNQATRNMSAADARKLLKSPAPIVSLVVGRLRGIGTLPTAVPRAVPAFDSMISSTQSEIFSGDPALECYDTDLTTVVLQKSELGVGLALDGGRSSKYGDRPVVVKKVFAVGSAARSGRIHAGDQVCAIDGCSLHDKTQLEAWKILKGRPEGAVIFEIRKRISAPSLTRCFK